MIAGEGSRDQHEARALAYRDPARMREIIGAIVDHTVVYLRGQIDAGAEAIQLFDSWAGSLAPDEFDRWVIAPNAAIVAALKESHPDTPVIGFPKGAGEKLVRYAERTGVMARDDRSGVGERGFAQGNAGSGQSRSAAFARGRRSTRLGHRAYPGKSARPSARLQSGPRD